MSGARDILAALGGRGGQARCPAHDDHTPSLSVTERDGRVLVKCHAGCTQDAVIRALRALGLWDAQEPGQSRWGRQRRQGGRGTARPAKGQPHRRLDTERVAQGRAFWASRCKPLEGTGGERYLRRRGLLGPLPPDIAFCPNYYGSPALANAIRDANGTVQAVQIIRLRDDFTDKLRPTKAMKTYRTEGPAIGGTVRLCAPSATLALAEGIEDALSVIQGADQPCWAALGVSGWDKIWLPEQVNTVILCPDADQAGQGTIERAAEHFRRQGLKVQRASVPAPHKDWNEWLIEAAPESLERAAIQAIDGGVDE